MNGQLKIQGKQIWITNHIPLCIFIVIKYRLQPVLDEHNSRYIL